MKPQWAGVMALAASPDAVVAVAVAHHGATGLLLDRMNGMTAMRDKVAELGVTREPAPRAVMIPMTGMGHSQMDLDNEN